MIGTILMNGASFFKHGTTARSYDGMVQRLNLLLGTKRLGKGREVRAILPITVRPSTIIRAAANRTTPFVGRRCQMTESSLFFRDDDTTGGGGDDAEEIFLDLHRLRGEYR
jgi:hypothetical protein